MKHTPRLEDPATLRLRSGAAAQSAGLPVTTLRVWERRYGVGSGQRTATGQRLYTALDVQRLRLLKQLTDRGHSIGTIGTLPMESLQGLAGGLTDVPAAPVRRTVTVGGHAAHLARTVDGIHVVASFEELDHAEDSTPSGTGVDLLLVHLPSLQPDNVERLLRLSARWAAGHLAVLYTFGAETLAESLRAVGATVRRDPTGAAELSRLLAPWAHNARPWSELRAEPRRFDDRELFRIADMPTSIECECTRHVAQIVGMLAGFEKYSADCGGSHPEHLALHRHLHSLAGVARTLLEHGLQRLLERTEAMQAAPLAEHADIQA